MGRILGIAGFGLLMAALSAAGSWFVQSRVLKQPPPQAAAQEEGADAAEAAAAAGSGAPVVASDSRLPVAVRPRDMSVEELLRYGMGVKQREQQVRQQEELLQQRRVQQQLALADISGERQEVDGLRIQIADQLKAAEKLVEKLQATRQSIQAERAAAEERFNEIKESRVEIDSQHLDNTKRLSQWMQGMEPEKAASLLKEMANEGKADVAVQIISHFEEREAAKILSAIDDPKLLNELVEKFRNLKRPTQSAAR